MKKALLYGLTAFMAVSCGGVKKTQEAVNTGNYEQAIYRAIDNLESDSYRGLLPGT